MATQRRAQDEPTDAELSAEKRKAEAELDEAKQRPRTRVRP